MPRFLLPLFLCVATAFATPRINEVQSTNTSFPDQYGQLIDWVEIHNASDSPINLESHYLSDSTTNRLKFQFPSGTTIAPRSYLLVWCGQATEFPTTGPYPAGQLRAAGFAISSNGEPIVLTAPDGTTVLDEFPALVIGLNGNTARSLGRGIDANFGVLFFYNSPTPNAANTTSGTPTETLAPPAFSVPGGIFTSNVTLSLAATNGTTIRYTRNGTDPTETSPIYAGPLALGPGGDNSTGYSWIPTNRQNLGYDESWQPPEGSVFRINVIRARAFKPGVAPSPIATHSYLIDPAGANRYPFPVVSINADPAGLFSDATGIYVHGSGDFANYYQDGSAWERPGQVEFFEPGGTTGFRGNMGVRLHGNTSVNRPRKSLRIYARESNGAPFNHRIFPQKEINQFSTFLLRNSGNDWGQAMLRDAFLTSLAAHTGVDHQSNRPAVVFLNGEYWGLHNLRDRIDEGYYLQHHGLGEMDFTQLDVHWQPAPLRPHWPVYDRGNPDPAMVQDFEDILNRANNNEYASESSFATIANRIDVENYIDYNAYQIFAGNGDWPANNTRLWRAVTSNRTEGARKTHDGRWRWILFDTDMGLGLNFDYVPGWNSDAATHAQVNTLALATSESQTSFANAPDGTLLLRKLTANPVFRTKFINRFADLLNTSMSSNRTTSELTQIQALYSPGIPEHKSRWRQPYNWSADMDRIRTFLQVRPSALRGHIASKFNTSQVPLTVTANATQGTVTVNSITLNSTTPGIAAQVFPWTGTYFQNIPVTLTATPKPGYRFVSWTENSSGGSTDGIVSTSPSPPVAGSSVTITYNPAGRPLENANSVYLHFAPNDWNNRITPRPAMSRNGSLWQYTYTIPSWATVLRIAFTATPEGNDSGPWDTNSGADWNLPVAASGTAIASDSTSNYSDWNNGNNGGNGFGAWVLNDTASSSDGFFIAGSSRAIHSTTPDGRAFGIFAHSGGNASAVRTFSTGQLTANQTFRVKISPGGFTGSKGIQLSSGGEPLLSFSATRINSTNGYYLRVGSSNSTRLTAFSTNSDSTFTFSVARVSNATNEHRITITRDSTSYTTSQVLASPVDRVVFQTTNASSSADTNNLYFNELLITDSQPASNDPVTYTDPSIQLSMLKAAQVTASFELEPAVTLVVETPPAAIPGTALSSLRVKAVNSVGDVDGNYDAQPLTLVITGPNGFLQTLNATITDGVADFSGITLPSTGEFSFTATSGSLATSAPQTFSPGTSARFLPTGNATWTTAANWDIQAVPNNNLASATLPAPQNQTVNRDATISSPVTIASVVFENGASTLRNRITGTTGNALTFSSANGTSSITVTGNGTGHANIEVPAGVVAQNDVILDVQNTAAGNSEYGALRLQGTWSGPGGFIKRGPGLAGITGANKTFSGNITIEHGALTFSEPAVTSNTAALYTVLPGGQLRLSSAGNPRQYRFSGPIHLSGNGRTGVPGNENLGVLGALRLETGGNGTNAFIENSVVLIDHADIHVPALNTITLNSSLVGNSTLSKSGGGTLHLPASASTFSGGITVQRGILHLAANLTANKTLELAAETTLTGNGTWGGLLRLPSGSILSPVLDGYPLRTATLQIDIGSVVLLTTSNQTASGLYPILTAHQSADDLANLVLSSIPTHHPQTRLVKNGNTLYALLAKNPREAWLLENNLPLNSPEDSDSDSDGFSHLVERALAMNPNSSETAPPTSIANESGNFTFTYRVARNQVDLTVSPEHTASLSETWTPVASEIHDDTHPQYQIRRAILPSAQAGFMRLRIAKPAE